MYYVIFCEKCRIDRIDEFEDEENAVAAIKGCDILENSDDITKCNNRAALIINGTPMTLGLVEL